MEVELSGHYGYRRIVRTMVPMVLTMLVTSVYTIVDGFFISNYAGSDAFAGMNLIWPPMDIVCALGLMIGAGGSALVSKTFGEQDPERANRIFSMLLKITIIVSAAFAVMLFITMPRLARALGADEAMLPYCVQYGRIIVTVLPACMLQRAFTPFFMVAERPHFSTVLSIACGLTNVVLDFIFIAVFGWGLVGAALATSASLLVGGGLPLWFFRSKRNRTQLKLVPCSFDWKAIAKSCSNGMSEFVGSVSLSVVSICYNWQLMRYIGSDGVSAYGVIMYVGFIFAAVFIGYNMGISQIIAYNYGARNREEMKSLLKKSIVITGLCGIGLTAFAELAIPYISRIFVGYSKDLCELTVHASRIYMLSFLFCGFNMFASAWFTSLNNGLVSAVAAFVRTLVFELAAVFVLPLILGIEGIWMAVNVAEFLALALSTALIAGFAKKYGYNRNAR